jgi:hypothetical protein
MRKTITGNSGYTDIYLFIYEYDFNSTDAHLDLRMHRVCKVFIPENRYAELAEAKDPIEVFLKYNINLQGVATVGDKFEADIEILQPLK